MKTPEGWRIRDGVIDLGSPRIMGILNITPNSFSDGGRYLDPASALDQARALVESGAHILDIGGESTRPGAERVDSTEQINRVIPVIESIRSAGLRTPISIDTTRVEVAQAAIEAGASIINDIAAGTESEGMLSLAAETGAGLVLMHRRMQKDAPGGTSTYPTTPDYPGGVVGVVREYLKDRAEAAIAAGVAQETIVLDPGLGFGKSVEQNYQLIARTGELMELGFPILSAASRKSFIGSATGVENPAKRVAGSLSVSVAHFRMGVRLFRVHDPLDHAQALAVAAAIEAGNNS
ncbi:MAG: dihydropteroate synthase [Phycisphaerales bacterium JB065]